jgi:hypothetical protein
MAPQISSVFTPRQSEVNLAMYVSRPEYEKALLRSINGSMHSLLFGESGNGKSWLYKKVLGENATPYIVANCANASRFRSITEEIYCRVFPDGKPVKTAYSEGKEAKANALIAEGSFSHVSEYEIHKEDRLLSSFKQLASTSGEVTTVIVLDNLESIFDNEALMDELADIIILHDDSRYAKYRIKFLIVGVPNGVLEYFAKTKNLESVANRIDELQKLSSLTKAQVSELVRKGFISQLGYNLSDAQITAIANHVSNVTMGVAQRVHEYCEKLAYQIVDAHGAFSSGLLEGTDLEWLKGGLRQSYVVLEGHLNSRQTTIARRNQVIYAIGKISSHQFDSNQIEKILRTEFPDTVPETNMGVGSILSELASGETPLLKRNSKTNEYQVLDPRYVMCIRAILAKDRTTQRVFKKQFQRC